MSAIKDVLKRKEFERIAKHMPAKNAPELTVDEKSDVEEFLEALDNAIISGEDKSRHIEDDGFHPSSLGVKHGKCARRAVYLLRGVPKEAKFPPRILRVFANGHAVHDRLQSLMETMGIEMESEIVIKTDDPVPIRGHADGVIEWNGRRILIEIKSCNENVFLNRLKWKKAKDEHVEQANIYAYVLNIDVIWVIYENKNSQDITLFEVKANRTKAETQIEKWRKQYEAFKQGKLPKRPFKPDSPTCASCDFKAHCFADSEVGVSI
jgi:CRISPR/Cas system-associated exonuclease Cas4 (RecB family)